MTVLPRGRTPRRSAAAARRRATRSCATGGSAGIDAGGARGARRHAVPRLRPGGRHAPGRGARAASCPPAVDLAYAVKANPNLAGRAPPRRPRAWARTWRRAASCGTRSGPGSPPDRDRGHRARQARRGAAGRRRGRRPGRHRRVAGRAPPARGDRRVARPAPAGPAPGRGVRGGPPRARPARRRRRRGQVRDGPARPAGRRRRGRRVALARAARAARVRGVQRRSTRRRSPATSRRPSRRRSSSRPGRGFALRLVDAGGGLGIPYERHGDELDVRVLGRAARGGCAPRLAADATSAATRGSCSSPGGSSSARPAPTSPAWSTASSTGGHHVVILDGGIHHVLRPALVGQEHRVRVLTGRAAVGHATAQRFPVTVAGPLCSGLDVFAAGRGHGRCPTSGDLVAVLDVGRLRRDRVDAVLPVAPAAAGAGRRGGEARVARPRIEPETWLGWQA